MPLAAIGGAIGIGSHLLGGILGSSAADNAAKAQQQGAQQALQNDQNLVGQAGASQAQATAAQTANALPYMTAGSGAINNLANLLGPNGTLTTPYKAFDPNSVNISQDPGYLFRQQQGNAALQNSAAARGGLLSTGTAKNLLDFNSGLASQEYNNAYGRALSTYDTNASNYYTGQNNTYSRLMGLSSLGQNSTLNLNNNLQQGAQNNTAIDLTGAGMEGQQFNNIAAARASGYIGSNNAWQGALGGIANSGMGMIAGLGSNPNLFGGSSWNPNAWAERGTGDYGQPG